MNTKHFFLRLTAPSILLTLALSGLATAESKRGVIHRDSYLARPEVQSFLADVAKQHRFDRGELDTLFENVVQQTKVLKAIKRPAEAKPWYQYRKIFITSDRISQGVEYWDENEAILERARATYGVAPEIVVAIIGVETFYGRRTGGFPVLDTLTTLGFDYPPRSRFFRRELEQFLLLAREESMDAADIKGSYAGAMGKGQFIPSSYRAYAVDFDDDGVRDLWGSNADAIGSVANYFNRHGWRPDAPVAVEAVVSGDKYQKFIGKGMKPSIEASTLISSGVKPTSGELDGREIAFFEFELRDAKQYWVGYNNFYVITRYNRSPLYAMAVYQLSQKIKQSRAQKSEHSRS